MQVGLYRKTVMKSLDTRAAKMGLKLVSKSTARTNLALATVGFAAAIGELQRSLTPYILGLQFTKEMQGNAKAAFGDAGHHLMILCRVLKVKTPVASKSKSKLAGTRTAALLHLAGLSTDMLKMFGGHFRGPHMEKVERLIVLPKQGGKKEMRTVLQVDLEKERAAEADRQQELRGMVIATVDLYWRLSLDIFGVSPSTFFAANAQVLKEKMKPVVPKGHALSSKTGVEAHPAKGAAIKGGSLSVKEAVAEAIAQFGGITSKKSHKPVPAKPKAAKHAKPVPPKPAKEQGAHA